MSNVRLAITSLWLLVNLAASSAANAAVLSTNTTNATITERVTTLERISSNQAQLIQQLQQQLNSSQNDIDSLRNSIQQNTYQLNQAVERQKQLFLQLDKLSTTATMAAPTARTPEKSTSELTPDAALSVKEPTQSEVANSEYNAAMDLILKSKQYDKAITALQTWVRRFPQSTYQPNANYWLGQLHYIRKQSELSSYYFALVVKNFPTSPKAPEALLKVGDIFQQQKQFGKAHEIYQQVIARYPKTASAKMAAVRIQQKQPLAVLKLMD